MAEAVTVLIRLIRSFEYRNVKPLVLQQVDKNQTFEELVATIKHHLETDRKFAPIKNHPFDTLKIYTHKHGHKPNNLVINFENDDWVITDWSKTLNDYGIEDESELSFFNNAEYLRFKENPEIKW